MMPVSESSEGFETVDHDILINLDKLGIRGQLHHWFQSYLQNRTQYLEYCDVLFLI